MAGFSRRKSKENAQSGIGDLLPVLRKAIDVEYQWLDYPKSIDSKGDMLVMNTGKQNVKKKEKHEQELEKNN